MLGGVTFRRIIPDAELTRPVALTPVFARSIGPGKRVKIDFGMQIMLIQSKAGPLSRDIFVNDLLAMERHSQMRVGNLIDGF